MPQHPILVMLYYTPRRCSNLLPHQTSNVDCSSTLQILTAQKLNRKPGKNLKNFKSPESRIQSLKALDLKLYTSH